MFFFPVNIFIISILDMSSSKYSYCTEVKAERTTLEWTIKNFSLLLEDKGTPINSPYYYSENKKEKWQITFYPRGDSTSANDYTAIYLNLKSGLVPVKIQNEFSIIESGIVIQNYKFIHEYKSLVGFGLGNFTPRSRLLASATDTLTICCKIDKPSGNIVTSLPNPTTAIPQPLCVDKNNGRLTENFAKLLENSNFSDVTIIVKDEKFSAHKVVLAARSPVFAAMFQNTSKENRTSAIEIERMEPSVVKGMLDFIYTDKVSNFEEISSGLLSAADKYDLVLLKALCEESLAKTLSNENAVEILVLANLHQSKNLKEHVMQYMHNHLTDIIESEGYKEMDEYPRLLKEFIRFMALQEGPSVKRRRMQS